MNTVTEARKQLLISLLKAAAGAPVMRSSLAPPEKYFRSALVDWSASWDEVIARGWVLEQVDGVALTPAGEELAQQLALAYPPMYYWYEQYYTAAPHSAAYGEFCQRLYGLNGCQHGFSDMSQVDRLISATGISTDENVLDLGCGTGHITEYIAKKTGAFLTGIDYSPAAIEFAQQRTSGNRRLTFRLANMSHLPFSASSMDVVVAIDTLYFTDLAATIAQIARLLRPGGRLATYYGHGWEPWQPKESFDPSTLPPERTPLGMALTAAAFCWQSWDVTAEDLAHAQVKKQLLEELRPQLEAEGNLFLYSNRHGEAEGVSQAITAGLQRRYLYMARTTGV